MSEIHRFINLTIIAFPKQSGTKRLQKVALIQPTLDGHVFSSGAIKQPPLEIDVFKLGNY
jgi:hypothetical protein